MSADVAKHIDPARREGGSLEGQLNHMLPSVAKSIFQMIDQSGHSPCCFILKMPSRALNLAPRSRRDKDMSDNKTNKLTIRVLQVVEFCISPGKSRLIIKKGDCHLF